MSKRKRKLNPSITRVGDVVRIVTPKIFVRCGYPLSIADMKKEVDEILGDDILKLFSLAKDEDPAKPMLLNNPKGTSQYNTILKELAYMRLRKKRFGGKERKIFTEDYPNAKGKEAIVEEIKYVKTGTYQNGYSGYDHYSGGYDYEPAYLDGIQTHKILTLSISKKAKDLFYEPISIESDNVEKLMSEEERIEKFHHVLSPFTETV